ncbi:transmembrane protein 216 isoform X1 [Saimiri boliviensis]|uniref:transmembrane protein 216 isoform X1 n=1 Tax=Saimiri boliviensis TaxID=27679 RepID=UPI00193CEDBB|nr:transmembrane protein 216 isoform X1 [Saimiri boliviensis boliviensis]
MVGLGLICQFPCHIVTRGHFRPTPGSPRASRVLRRSPEVLQTTASWAATVLGLERGHRARASGRQARAPPARVGHRAPRAVGEPEVQAAPSPLPAAPRCSWIRRGRLRSFHGDRRWRREVRFRRETVVFHPPGNTVLSERVV